ncbi:MAG TPA: polyprenol monophosphomannose synthase [Baekduia sp.]|uniref:polyprenol monophosphomannose synthase n=1 Tax=Baekduia sp. TaxID=2600305 RepID=UPI002D786C28|nr:polyprenol monophosphomannose synthase [Baekduia sp.]HET6505164.1 polyprenol monophosphomannose synthase [Baekduia sp.]
MRLRTLLMIALTATLGLAVWTRRHDLAAFDWTTDPATLLGAAALLAVPGLVQAATFAIVLRRVGADAAWRPALRMWARSWLLRYEPSGAVGFAYRVGARERVGASTPQVLTATAYEQLAAVAGGALAAPIGFAAAGTAPPWYALAAAPVAVVVVAALRPAWLGGWLRRRLRARGVEAAAPLRGREVAGLVALHAVGWCATAGALALLAPGHGAALLGAVALSWLSGVLVPIAPGGLGVRDAVLAVGAAPVLGAGGAAAFAITLRVVGFAGELASAGVAELVAAMAGRREPARAPASASATAATCGAAAPGRERASVSDPRGVIVVVPTFDEAEMLPLLVERFARTGLELLIVDDASPDGTGDIADVLAAERPWMHVLHRAGKDGLGAAYRAGFGWCLERGYRAVGQMDCDLSHPPEKLAEMLEVLDTRGADLVIGNRYLPGGSTTDWSPTRRVLSRVGCTLSRALLGLPYDDLSGGFKLWRASCLHDLDLDATLAAGYAFQIETTQLAHLLGKRIEEIPFAFGERVAGESKMSLAISLEGIGVCLKLRRRAHRWAPTA